MDAPPNPEPMPASPEKKVTKTKRAKIGLANSTPSRKKARSETEETPIEPPRHPATPSISPDSIQSLNSPISPLFQNFIYLQQLADSLTLRAFLPLPNQR